MPYHAVGNRRLRANWPAGPLESGRSVLPGRMWSLTMMATSLLVSVTRRWLVTVGSIVVILAVLMRYREASVSTTDRTPTNRTEGAEAA